MANKYKDDKQNEVAIFTYNNGLEKVTKSDIYGVLEMSAINHGFDCLDDLTEKCSSAKFNLILQDIGDFFKSNKALIKSYQANPYNITWEYDKNILYILTDIYSNICFEYNKMISLYGFLFFCGIGGNKYFQYDEKQPLELSDNLRLQIAEKLKANDDFFQKMRARDSNNPILQLAYNNYEHGWNGEIRRNEIKGAVKSLEDIRKERLELSSTDEQFN